MKLGISNIAWNLDETLEVYDLMKKYRFDGLEIAPSKVFGESPYFTTNLSIDKFKDDLIKNNFNLISMQSILYNQDNLNIFDMDTASKAKDYIKSCIDFASKIDCIIIVFGSPKNRVYTNKYNYLEYSKNFFKDIGEHAHSSNVKFCIESNPIQYNTNFINNLSEQLYFIDSCNQRGLGTHIDLGSMILNNEDFSILANMVDKIDHIHLSLPFLEKINTSNIRIFKDLVYILDGYKNYISIEMKNNLSKNINNIEIALDCVANIFRV